MGQLGHEYILAGNGTSKKGHEHKGLKIMPQVHDHLWNIRKQDKNKNEQGQAGRSEIRNCVLAPIFKDMKLIEAWGSGIQKMKTELKDYPEIELILQEAGHAFQVQFIKKAIHGTKLKAESRLSWGRVGVEWGQSHSQSRANVQPECSQSH